MLIRPPGLTVLLTTAVSLCYFPGGSVVKNLPAKAGDGFDHWVRKIPLGKEMATYSTILAWEIP